MSSKTSEFMLLPQITSLHKSMIVSIQQISINNLVSIIKMQVLEHHNITATKNYQIRELMYGTDSKRMKI